MEEHLIWQNLSKTPRVFGIDAKAFLPVILLIFNASITSLILVIVSIIGFAVLEKFGLNVPTFLEKLYINLEVKQCVHAVGFIIKGLEVNKFLFWMRIIMFKKTLLYFCIISILSGCATHRAINTADKDISAMHSAENVDKSKAIGDLSQTTLNEDLFLPVNDLDNMFIALEQDNVSDLLPKIMIKDRSFSQANAFDVVRDLLDGTGISFTISSETTTSSLVNASISAIKINGFLPDLVEQLSKSLGFHYSYNAKTKNLDIYLDKQYISKVPPVNEIFESLPNMLRVLGGTNVFLDKSARNISYRANKVAASKIEKYLKEIRDSRVLLTYDTYIWEVSLNDGNQMGINWNNLSSNLAYRGAQGAISVTGTGPTITNGIGFGMVLEGKNGNWNVDTLLSVLRSVGTVKTVSQPRINLLSGTNASFNNGETINYVSRVGSVAGGLGTTATTTKPIQFYLVFQLIFLVIIQMAQFILI